MNISKICAVEVQLEHVGHCHLPLFLQESKTDSPNDPPRPPTAVRTAILYGRNGAGKSSIARAISDGTANFVHLDGTRTAANELSEKVHVFSDKYIEENFRQLESPSINPIVLLGDAVADHDELTEVSDKLTSLNAKLEDLEREISSKRFRENEKIDEIKARLKDRDGQSRGSWALRSKEYHSQHQIMNVRSEVVDSAIRRARSIKEIDTSAIARLQSSFDECIESLVRARLSRTVEWRVPEVSLGFSIEAISAAVEKVTPHVKSGDSDAGLLQRIQSSSDSVTELQEKLNGLFSTPASACPHCFQVIDEEFRTRVREVISRHLDSIRNDAARADLEKLQVEWVPNIELPSAQIGDGASRIRVEAAQRSLIDICHEINARISQKVDNPRLDVSFHDLDLIEAVGALESALSAFSRDVEQHNRLTGEVAKIEREAATLNSALAGHEIFDKVVELDAIMKEREVLEGQRTPLLARAEQLGLRRALLQEKQCSEEKAAERVNNLLSIVFGGAGLRIRSTEAGYVVTNREMNVSPTRLSTGERNVLALCYFLVATAQGTSFESDFLSDRIIILDDPISSFDYDNKYGVVALMNWLAWTCGGRSQSTKIAIFTHDPAIAYDLSKTFASACSGHQSWEMSDGRLRSTKFEYIDNYGDMLRRMYNFAIDGSGAKADRVSPNDVRRVWEAFATFELGENPTNAVDSPKVSALLSAIDAEADNRKDYATFFKAFPGRSFLHADSHSSFSVKNFDYYMTPALDDAGLRRFVASVLLLMHAISPMHIPARMGGSVKLTEARRKEMEEALRVASSGGRRES